MESSAPALEAEYNRKEQNENKRINDSSFWSHPLLKSRNQDNSVLLTLVCIWNDYFEW